MKNKSERIQIYHTVIGKIMHRHLSNDLFMCVYLVSLGIDISELDELWLFRSPQIDGCRFFDVVDDNGKWCYPNEQRLFALTMCIEMILNPCE